MRRSPKAMMVVLGLAGCADHLASPTPPGTPAAEPVVLLSAAVSQSLPGGESGAGSLVFVSARPGAFPRGARAMVGRRSAAPSLAIPVAAGGFDPVALRADVGDEIEITVTDSTGARRVETGTVRAPMRPKVVRTSPGTQRSDVPLNLVVQVVFSAPMDAASVSAALELYRGETRVPGTVTLTDEEGTIASFVPEVPFEPSTDYRLVLAASARDVLGQVLDSSVVVTFTTGASTSAPPITVVAIDREVERLEPGEAVDVRAFVCTQHYVPCIEVTAEVSWSSTLPGVAAVEDLPATAGPGRARITAVSVGETRVVAAAGGQSDTMVVHVASVPPASLAASELVFSATDPAGVSDHVTMNLFAIRADGTGLTQLTRVASRAYTQPSVARDGRIVFVEDNAQLMVRELDGTVHPLSPVVPTGSWLECPTWSPDMRFVAYRATPSEWTRLPPDSVHVVRADGSGAIVAAIGGAACPSWSPDGRQLSFGYRLEGDSFWGLRLGLADATLLPAVGTRASEWFVQANFGRWSPAGDAVAVYVEEGAHIHVERMSVASGLRTRLGLRLSILDCCSIMKTPYLPDWSPDGSLIAGTLGDGGIFLTDATGLTGWTRWLPVWGDHPAFVPAGVTFTR